MRPTRVFVAGAAGAFHSWWMMGVESFGSWEVGSTGISQWSPSAAGVLKYWRKVGKELGWRREVGVERSWRGGLVGLEKAVGWSGSDVVEVEADREKFEWGMEKGMGRDTSQGQLQDDRK